MKGFLIKLWLFVVIALMQTHGYKCCLEKERSGLLEVKAFFKSVTSRDVDKILTSWVNDKRSDCCRWEQVKCNSMTGRVVKLFLRNTRPSFRPDDRFPILNLSLLHPFEELRILDLSYNNFADWDDNKGLGLANLRNLKALDISNNRLNGSLGSQVLGICELKNLVELDLSYNEIGGHLPQCLSNLTYLKVLDLSSNQLHGSLPSVITNLTSLEYLALSDNNFEGLFSFNSLVNHSKLEVFKLSTRNNLLRVESTKNQLPTYQLKFLSLCNYKLQVIPTFLLHQYNLQVIDLSHNKLVGKFPTWLLQNSTKLEAIYLVNNSLTGILELPRSKHLLHLGISSNNFSGQLPKNLGKILPKVKLINMSKNYFEGNIPSSMGDMRQLTLLDLSSNKFSGELPRNFITGCFSLIFLKLSDNNFHGQVFPKYMNLDQLIWLYLDNNHFSGKIGEGLSKAKVLAVLDISNNELSGEIPPWIGNFSNLRALLMSKNLLQGSIPNQIGDLQSLEILDISENRLSGRMPSSLNMSSLMHFFMQRNAISGSIPNALFKSTNLLTVDLRDNKLSGSIPQWIYRNSNLRFLLIGGNHLQSEILNQLCQVRNLNILDLSRNKLNGSIPSCLTNMLSWMVGDQITPEFQYEYFWELLDASDSSDTDYNFSLDLHLFEDTFTLSDQQLEVKFTTKNRYESYKGNILNYMTGLDLSGNNLTGNIPSRIGELQNLHALNLSHNSLSGSIPHSFSYLKMIESLDLSHNKLSGQIPPQLTELYNLEIFNVSHNNLSGQIPNKGQFATFEEVYYEANPGLCGPLIKKGCTNTPILPSSPSSKEEDDESVIDMVAFYWSFTGSYITIMSGLLVIFWINAYWRKLWFYFIDACINTCYYWFLKYVLQL